MRPERSLQLSLEKPRSSTAPCGCRGLSSFPSSLFMLLAGYILPQKGFLELSFGFLFGVQHSVLFSSCTLPSGAGKPPTCPSAEPVPLLQCPLLCSLFGDLEGAALVLWPCNCHQRGDVAPSLCLGVGVLSRALHWAEIGRTSVGGL